jgi:hypothetical protein
MNVHVVTWYVATKWGPMQERERIFAGHLPEASVRVQMQSFLGRMQERGVPVYPKFDVEKAVR